MLLFLLTLLYFAIGIALSAYCLSDSGISHTTEDKYFCLAVVPLWPIIVVAVIGVGLYEWVQDKKYEKVRSIRGRQTAFLNVARKLGLITTRTFLNIANKP